MTSGHLGIYTTLTDVTRALITPDEVGRLFGDPNDPAALVLVSGQQPLYVRRRAYFAEKPLRGYYDPHRDHAPPPTLIQAELQAVEERERAKVEQALAAQKAEADRQTAARRAAVIREEKAREAAAREEQALARRRIQRRKDRVTEAILSVCSYGIGGLLALSLWWIFF